MSMAELSGATPARRGLLRDARRLSMFAAKRLVALFLTVLIGVYLTILIANMGGQVDELRLVQIRTNVGEQVRADPAFFDLPAAERNELIERQVQLADESGQTRKLTVLLVLLRHDRRQQPAVYLVAGGPRSIGPRDHRARSPRRRECIEFIGERPRVDGVQLPADREQRQAVLRSEPLGLDARGRVPEEH